MAVVIKNDSIETLSCTERMGAIVEMTRICKVIGYTGAGSYLTLTQALNEAGVPQFGSTPAGSGFESLRLFERQAKVVHDGGEIDVTLNYQHILDGATQNLGEPGTGVIYGEMRASVSQKTTNFYRPNGVGVASQVLVAHTFPEDDPDHPGRTFIQGGEINVFVPEKNFRFEGYYDTAAPWLLANDLIGSINSGLWMNEGTWEWMCTEVQWKAIKPLVRYKFQFEFQHNYDTWNPTAVFIDERTGKPPPNLIPGTGYVQVPYHKVRNFNISFGAFFEGWQQVF